MVRPLIYVDIDGVLNRYQMHPNVAAKRGYLTVRKRSGHRTFTLRLDPADTGRLLSLTDLGDLAWGTTWQGDAPSVGAEIGLPDDMPVARRTKPSEYRKSIWLVTHAGDRPFVWFDDQAYRDDRAVIAHHKPGALIVDVDPELGLTDANVATARAWLENMGSRPGPA